MKRVLYSIAAIILFVGFITMWIDRVEKINNGEIIVENHTSGY